MLTNQDFLGYWEAALPIDAYLDHLLHSVPDEAVDLDKYLAINQQRVKRLVSRFQLQPEVEMAALNAEKGSKWLIINEHWCGDGAQILPVQAAIARASNGRIEAKVVFRDQNLALMDAFLTNGGRSIPKTIQLNEAFEVTGTWGPRPQFAMELVARSGTPKTSK
ncbi:MAG: thioredoxin family protein [Flavobacteriia bacterium]|nr:thioredoxin family protein [Flavobacteriia bacterium]